MVTPSVKKRQGAFISVSHFGHFLDYSLCRDLGLAHGNRNCAGYPASFFELRYDAEKNEIGGTAMLNGDTVDIPLFGKERFEPGAFGDLGQSDLILNAQHDRTAGIARTGGAGLDVMDSYSELANRALLDPEDPDARKTLSKVNNGILRGISIEFLPDTYRCEMAIGEEITINEKAELRGFSVVDRPAYKQSTLREEDDMDPKE